MGRKFIIQTERLYLISKNKQDKIQQINKNEKNIFRCLCYLVSYGITVVQQYLKVQRKV